MYQFFLAKSPCWKARMLAFQQDWLAIFSRPHEQMELDKENVNQGETLLVWTTLNQAFPFVSAEDSFRSRTGARNFGGGGGGGLAPVLLPSESCRNEFTVFLSSFIRCRWNRWQHGPVPGLQHHHYLRVCRLYYQHLYRQTSLTLHIIESLSTDVFDSGTPTGSPHFGIAINAHALTCWQEVTDVRRGCSPFVLFLVRIYHSEMVTSDWRPWIKNVCASLYRGRWTIK